MSYRIETIYHDCEDFVDDEVFAQQPPGGDEVTWRFGNREGIRACPWCGELLIMSWRELRLMAATTVLG